MTVAEAADIFERNKREIDKRRPQMEAAAKRLKEHFRKTGSHTYKGRIGYARSTQRRLDQDKVKEELGARLPRFQKTVDVESLSLISS